MNQNRRSYMNQMYMDHAELMRMRQEREAEQYGAPMDRPR